MFTKVSQLWNQTPRSKVTSCHIKSHWKMNFLYNQNFNAFHLLVWPYGKVSLGVKKTHYKHLKQVSICKGWNFPAKKGQLSGEELSSWPAERMRTHANHRGLLIFLLLLVLFLCLFLVLLFFLLHHDWWVSNSQMSVVQGKLYTFYHRDLVRMQDMVLEHCVVVTSIIRFRSIVPVPLCVREFSS